MEPFFPQEFAEVSSMIFKPAYSLIADQILSRLGVRSGYCLDLGSGTTALSFEISKRGDFKVISLDISLEMLKIGKGMFASQDPEGRVIRVTADVHHLPLKERSIDLVISRGSVFFWRDLKAAFQEILRVLKPEGVTYIGGGFGSEELKEQARQALQKRGLENNKTWKRHWDEAWLQIAQSSISSLNACMLIINDDTGLWFVLKRPSDGIS
jgi:ubiquinone/menaquinone biosynthesis C-methylase UbiE